MPHTVKRGDLKTLRWNLGRSLSGVTEAKVLIRAPGASSPLIARNGTVDAPASAGIVSLALVAGDWAGGMLAPTDPDGPIPHYLVEIQTQPGPLTHPDDGYERLYVDQDLGP